MTEEFELSEREIEIIRLVATGASNKEIAQKLVISPNTVKVHLRNIFSKLNVVSRTEATMTAIRMGWVQSPGNNQTIFQGNIEADNISTEESAAAVKNPVKKIFQSNWIWLFILMFVIISGLVIRTVILQASSPTETPVTNQNQSIITERWSGLENLPAPIKGMAAARYENMFILIGGESAEKILSEVWLYDVEKDAWSRGKDIPIAISDINATLIGEKIYVPGGRISENNASNQLFVYDPRSNSWDVKADLPAALSAYALTSYEGKIYLFGGWDGNNYQNNVWVYDPDSDSWQSLGKLPEERAFATAETVGGVIHILGGMNSRMVLKSHDLFYPQRLAENENAWESASDLPQARFGMESSVLADMIYVAGGSNDENVELPLIQYLPPKDTWMELDQPPISVGINPAVLPYETKLYVMGGETNDGFQNALQSYQAVYTVLVPVIRQ